MPSGSFGVNARRSSCSFDYCDYFGPELAVQVQCSAGACAAQVGDAPSFSLLFSGTTRRGSIPNLPSGIIEIQDGQETEHLMTYRLMMRSTSAYWSGSQWLTGQVTGEVTIRIGDSQSDDVLYTFSAGF